LAGQGVRFRKSHDPETGFSSGIPRFIDKHNEKILPLRIIFFISSSREQSF
jgi:hypothetical protein